MEVKIAVSLVGIVLALAVGYGAFAPPPIPPPLNAPKLLDISEWQGDIYPEAMKDADVSAVIVRASYGQWQDGRVIEYVAQLQAAGVPVAALYHEYDAAETWQTQYAALAAVLRETGVKRAAVYLDETDGAAAGVWAFMAQLRSEFPLPLTFRHLIYTDAAAWQALGRPAWGAEYELWLAEPAESTAPAPNPLAPWRTWKLWQWTTEGDGAANGVSSAHVGISRFNGSALQFESWLKMAMVFGGGSGR